MATLELYPYQQKMLGALRNGFNAGHKVQMLYAPCGGGKTELAIAMMDALEKRGLRSTMLLDLTNLCDQTSKRLSKYGIDHGVVMPESHRYNTDLPIQVAMIQTIEKRKFWPKTDLLIIDEAHSTRSSVIEFIKSNPDMEVVGLSGSPFTKGLGAIYTNVVSRVTVNSLVENDRLILPMVYIAKPIDMRGAKKNTFGEWTNKEVAARGAKVTGDIVSEWENKTASIFGGPAKTIVFCAGVDHGKDLAERFAAKGYTFIALSHKSDPIYRADAMAEFAKPDSFIHGLIATDLLTKGFDQTDISVMISARPFTKSFSSHVQQIGRIMRVHSSKDKALLLDHSGNYLRHQEQWDDVCENGVHVLNDVSEEAKKEPTDKEKEAAKCPKCGLLWPANADMCACGYVRERRNSVSEVAGEMFELVGKKEKKEKFSMEQKTDFYAMSIQYRILKGYKKGWEFFNYKKKFGVEPSMKTPAPKQLDDDFRNWITHLAMQNKYKKAA